MKKERRKKRKIQENDCRNNGTFQDEASITTPILASNLSTSISIIDIEKYQNVSEMGCQKNKDNFNTSRRKNTMIYSDEDSTSPSVSPKNTRLFQSRRIQVGENPFSRGDYHFHTRKLTYTYPTRNNITYYNKNNIENYRRYVGINKKTQKSSPPALFVARGNIEKVSYPDVNIHVISMMLPGLNESLVYDKTRSEKTKEEKREQNEKGIKQSQQFKHDTFLESPVITNEKYPVTKKEVEILWEHSVKTKGNGISNYLNKNSADPDNVENNAFTKSMKILQKQNDACRKIANPNDMSKQICMRDQCEQTENRTGKVNDLKNVAGGTTEHYTNSKITLCIRKEENLNWIPKIMKRMQNCFSYVKDILVDKKECITENQENARCENIRRSISKIFAEEEEECVSWNQETIAQMLIKRSISRIFSEEEKQCVPELSEDIECRTIRESITKIFSEEKTEDSIKKDFVTLFCRDKTTSSSTNFIPHISTITSNNPDFTLQDPYSKNYFVYFNNNITGSPLPMSDFKISEKFSHCRSSFLKQRKLLNRQYSCLMDVAKVTMCLTEMLARIYKDDCESSYPSTKCFTSIFRIREIFRKVSSINQPLYLGQSNKTRKRENCSQFQILEPQEIVQDILRVNHSLPVCRKRSKRNARAHVLKEVDVIVISSNSVLVRWIVPKTLEMKIEVHKIFLDNVLQCTLKYFETCAVLENVDLSKPLSITIMTYTADGYCYSTKIKTALSSN